jgi:hypothetical protein
MIFVKKKPAIVAGFSKLKKIQIIFACVLEDLLLDLN